MDKRKINKHLLNQIRYYQRLTGVCGLVGLKYPHWYPDNVCSNEDATKYIEKMKKDFDIK